MNRMPSPTHRITAPSARWFTKLWATDEGVLVFVSKVVSFMRLRCYREMTRVYSREWVQGTERCGPEIEPKRKSSENNRKKNLTLCPWMIAIITQYHGGAPSAMARARRNRASSAWFSHAVATVPVSFVARPHYKLVRCSESVGKHNSKPSPLTSQPGFSYVSGDLMDKRAYGLWTLPRLWKTREARGARVACRLGEVVSCLQTQSRRFPQSLGKRSRVSHERPQAPPDINTRRICFIGIRKRNRLVEAMENALPGFEEHSVVVRS